MPRYSSSKNAWPTANLFVGGGPSRPFNRISITVTKPKTNFKIGPTVKAAKKLPRYVGNDRVLTVPKRNKIALFLDKLLEHSPTGTYPDQVKPRKKSSHHRTVEDAMGAQQ